MLGIIQSDIDQSDHGLTPENSKNSRLFDRFVGKLTYNRFTNLHLIIAIDFLKQDLVENFSRKKPIFKKIRTRYVNF